MTPAQSSRETSPMGTPVPAGSSDWEHSRDIQLPFSLTLASGEELECREILRLLPGRRLVARADLADKTVLLKMFLDARRRSEAAEDSKGARALADAGISTPALLWESSVSGKDYPVLVFEYLHGTSVFREAWEEASKERQSRLLTRLLEMVGQQHEAGLRQRDFHLRNFLVDEQEKLYAIDGGDFAIGAHPVGRRLSLKNLGSLFGHLPLEVLQKERGLLEAYLSKREWVNDDKTYKKIEKNSIRFRRRRARVISSKAFRDCSEFQVRRKSNLRICQRRDFSADALDRWIEQTGMELDESSSMLKDGHSQTVWRTRIGNREVVVKRYNLKNSLHAFRRALTRSRASRSWQNAHRLRAYHIPTPEPIAMIEERRGVLRGRAWLITEVAEGTGANIYFRSARDDEATIASMARLAAVVNRFGVNGIAHGDMKATNFILNGENIQVIDLDSMWQPLFSWRLRGAIAKDRKRFMKNWKDKRLRKAFSRLLN